MSAINKKAVRRAMIRRLQQLEPAVWTDAADRIADNLATLPVWRAARHVAVYLGLADEIPTQRMIDSLARRGATIYLPVYDAGHDVYVPVAWRPGEAMQAGKYGIMEPVSPQWAPDCRLDLVLVPGRAFTRDGARLGRGAGYYDRFLTAPWAGEAVAMGVSLEDQLIEDDLWEAHDVGMAWVITERRIYDGRACRPPMKECECSD